MGKKWKWGILGCGRIAEKFSQDLKSLANAELYATASRDERKAHQFAADFGYQMAYGSYEALVEDPLVDVIYVASPHSHHCEHTLLCLNHGKAVLCEKAFALNSAEVDLMVNTARKKKLFLMEAFWTRFQPASIKVQELLAKEIVGKNQMMRSDFAFNGPYDPENRLYNLALGGGSLLDIGIYPVFAALSVFGEPEHITTVADFSQTGSEESIGILFKYPGGQIASLQSSFAVYSSIQSEYWCEHGFIRIHRQGVTPTFVDIWDARTQKSERLTFEFQDVSGYHLEAKHVMDCLDQGLAESPELPLTFSQSLMKTLDRIREDAAISFPADK